LQSSGGDVELLVEIIPPSSADISTDFTHFLCSNSKLVDMVKVVEILPDYLRTPGI
jgi:hypothetical protein